MREKSVQTDFCARAMLLKWSMKWENIPVELILLHSADSIESLEFFSIVSFLPAL